MSDILDTDDGKWDATLKAFWRRMSLHSRSRFWYKADIPEDEIYIFRSHFATALLASPIKGMAETAKEASERAIADHAENQRLRAIIEQDNVEPVGRVEHRKDTTQYGLMYTHLPVGTKLYLHPPKDSTDKCEINPISSRMCEKGTKCCTVYHKKDSTEPASKDWVMVPREPTQEMWEATLKYNDVVFNTFSHAYAAMIAAAPTDTEGK